MARRKRDPNPEAAEYYLELARYQLRLGLDPHMAPDEKSAEERRRILEFVEQASDEELHAWAKANPDTPGAQTVLANLKMAARQGASEDE